MKKKQLLCMALVFAMACSAMSGCGSSGNSSTAKDESQTVGAKAANDAKSETTDDTDDKTITFWHIGTDEPDISVFENAVEQFNENTTSGYKIESVAVESDAYKEKLLIAMSSGECPDIYTSWSGGPMDEYIDAGYAQPLDDLFESAAWKDKLMDSTYEQGKYNGKLYGVGMLNVAVAGVFYNKDIFEKYNLEVPTTISELENVCETLKANNIIPFALANSEKWTGSMYFVNLATRKGGLQPFKDAVAGTGSFEDECFIWAGQKIQEWVKKGYFPEGVNSLSEGDGQSKQMFYTEEAAMKINGSWDAGSYRADNPDFYEKVGWFAFPAVDGSDVDASIMLGTSGDQFLSFNCTGEKLNAAFELLNYYFDDAYIQSTVNAGRIMPVKNVEDLIGDDQPLEKQIMQKVSEASDTQLWYDQYLPPAVSQTHLDTCQELFGLTMTPEEAAQKFQAAMEEYNSNK